MTKTTDKEIKKWSGQSKTNWLGIWIFIQIIRFAGLIPAYFLLVFVAFFYALFNRSLHKYLRSFRKKIGLKTNFLHIYVHNFLFGLTMIDKFAFLYAKKSPFKSEIVGEHLFHSALNRGKGVVLLSSHIGPQEIAGEWLFNHTKVKINYLMLDNERKDIKKVTSKITEGRDVNIIPTNSDGLDMMVKVKAALDRNEVVCLLGDRVMGDESATEIPFLGSPVRFPTAAFTIAAITGAAIVIVATIQTGYKKYTHQAFNLISFDNVTRQNRSDVIHKAMLTYVSTLEKIARLHYWQWFNFYDFWNEFP